MAENENISAIMEERKQRVEALHRMGKKSGMTFWVAFQLTFVEIGHLEKKRKDADVNKNLFQIVDVQWTW